MEKSIKAEEYSDNVVTKQLSDDQIESGGLNDPEHVGLQRALKARHITMIGRSKRNESKVRR